MDNPSAGTTLPHPPVSPLPPLHLQIGPALPGPPQPRQPALSQSTQSQPSLLQPSRPSLPAPLVCMLSAAHAATDLRVVGKEGAALAAAGWRVLHLCPSQPPISGAATVPDQHAGVRIGRYRRGRGWRGRLLGITALARHAANSGAAVLHASEPDAWFAALLAARRNGARVVLDVHEHYPSRLDGRLPAMLRPLARAIIRRACRFAARRADAVVVAKDGLDADFTSAPRLIAVRNYAAASAVQPRQHAAGHRESAAEPLTLVHLGVLGRARGAMTMLDTLALCPPGTRLLLLGRFTDGSEPDFLARAAALGLADRIDNRGWLPHAEALAVAARADLGLVLFQPGVENHRLALPHKMFDYMLAGLPVIAPSFAEEVAGIIREADCGVLVDAADPADIAAAIAGLADPALRDHLGGNGRRAALGRFGWEAEATRLVELYRDLAPLRHG